MYAVLSVIEISMAVMSVLTAVGFNYLESTKEQEIPEHMHALESHSHDLVSHDHGLQEHSHGLTEYSHDLPDHEHEIFDPQLLEEQISQLKDGMDNTDYCDQCVNTLRLDIEQKFAELEEDDKKIEKNHLNIKIDFDDRLDDLEDIEESYAFWQDTVIGFMSLTMTRR